MAVLTIVKTPNPILDKKTDKVTDFGEKTQKVIQDLKDTLESAEDPKGAGLSANQIGFPKSICVVRNFFHDPLDPENELFEEKVLINPKLISENGEGELDWEGCLSVPDTYGKVKRSPKIKIKYQNENGLQKRENLTGFFARVVQHEIDHLNGILFTSKVKGKTVTSDYFDEK